jgi:hypothetical protein
MKFEMELSQLLTVLAPVAKAITCMELTQSNVSDVYVFWLAVTATIHQIIIEDVTGLPSDVIEDICKAVNFQFNQMVNDAPDDVYHMGFMMDPRKDTVELFVAAMTDIWSHRVSWCRYYPRSKPSTVGKKTVPMFG